MNRDEARKLLDAYYEARRDEVECPEWTKMLDLSKYEIAEKACIDAMTQPVETISEQQREIDRLKRFISARAEHGSSCRALHLEDEECTCGLDEVLK